MNPLKATVPQEKNKSITVFFFFFFFIEQSNKVQSSNCDWRKKGKISKNKKTNNQNANSLKKKSIQNKYKKKNQNETGKDRAHFGKLEMVELVNDAPPKRYHVK